MDEVTAGVIAVFELALGIIKNVSSGSVTQEQGLTQIAAAKTALAGVSFVANDAVTDKAIAELVGVKDEP